MTEQTHDVPVDPDDDEFPTVRFSLRNMDGEGPEVELRTHLLGLERYLLVKPGDGAVELECSHMDLDTLAQTLGFLTATVLQADGISAETRDMVAELVDGSLEELEELEAP